MLTTFGKELRKMRIESGEVLKDMADRIGVSTSFLSAIETGKKNIPARLIDKLCSEYSLPLQRRLELEDAARKSVPTVKVGLAGASEDRRDMALIFARNFEDVTDETARQIIDLLSRGVDDGGGNR